MSFADTQKLTVQLDLAGNFQAKLGSAARALQGFDRSTSRTQQSLSKFGRNLERGVVLGATAAAGGFLAVTKAAGDFEAQLNTIATIVDRSQIPKIGEQLRQTARDTGVSLDDLTSAYYDLASAGIKGELASKTLNNAVALGIGGLATTAETVNLLSTAINAYGLDAAGAQKATDQFAQAIADGVVHADQIAASFADVASVAKASGVGIDQIATSYAFLTKQGVPATEVTTEMQRAIISLLSPTKELKDAGKALGVSWDQEIRKKGLVPALQEVATYAAKNHIPLVDLLGRIEAVKYTLQTTGPELKGYNAELAVMGKVSGVAAAQMAERQQGLNFQIGILKAGIKDAAITIGSELLPKLTPLVKKFNEFLNLPGTQGKIKGFATDLASGFQKLADAVGKVDWQPFIDGLKISGDIAKTVIGAFQSLPADLQKLVIAGFALNKVTGGLGTSIAKDIGGALLKNFAERGSSPANPLFVSQVGGIPGSPGGASGALGKVALVAEAAALAAAVIATQQEQSKGNSDLATGVSKAVSAQIGGGASLADLKQSLAAVDKGIADIANTPFGGLVAGDSLNQLLADRISISGQINAKSGGLSPDERDDLHAAAQRLQDVKDASQSMIVAIGQSGSKLLPILDALHRDFRADLHTLIHATKAADVAKAAKRIAAEIRKGVGNADTTKGVLADLKRQLANTHDPKLTAILKAAIDKVQAKLPGREFVQRQIGKADALLKDGKVTRADLKTIAGIERALKDRGLPHAAKVIETKVEAAKKAQVHAANLTTAAADRTKAAIDRKHLSVTVNSAITIRDVNRTITKFSRYSSVQS